MVEQEGLEAEQDHYKVVGLMSGSSLDGLDLAYVEFKKYESGWICSWIDTACIPYDEAWTARLRGGVDISARELAYLHADYGHYLGRTVKHHLDNAPVPDPDLIVSHGHTLFHDPARGMTCQIGDGAAIAAETGFPVVSDLRAMDVAYGGQGAPIVPLGEQQILEGSEFFLNLGGIANITRASDWSAWDICACNQVLNHLAERAGMAYDAGGELARTGTIIPELLQKLNDLPFFREPAPKSLDNSFSVREIIPLLRPDEQTSDLLRTVVEHIAMQIVGELTAGQYTEQIYVSGGGVLNDFLISRIKDLAKAKLLELYIPLRSTIEFKEAMIMAFLGMLRLRGEATVLTSVTGARVASSGGALWIPAGWKRPTS